MKKFFVLILVLAMQSQVFAASYIDRQVKEAKKNTKYNTVKRYNRNYDYMNDYVKNLEIKNLKDPGLIKLSNYTPVDEKSYANKLAKDKIIYEKEVIPVINKKMNSINVEPAAVDFYALYRVAERLIRANNLDYANWRITIRKSPEEINAYASTTNLITINTALYDSLYNNEEALAFVLAHEMSHLILGHGQRGKELTRKLNRWLLNNRTANAAVNSVAASVNLVQLKVVFEEYKRMEYAADSEAVILLIKAGYSPSKFLDGLNFLDIEPGLKYFISTHPYTQYRLENANENVYFADPDWIEEGKANIYNSEVLGCKKSSDRVSIVINKSENPKNNFYQPESIEKRLLRVAYASYKKGDMINAIKYFKKHIELENDYVSYLYLSYADEYLYKRTKEGKYIKRALKNAEEAYKLNKLDVNIKKQLDDLNAL